MPRTIETVVYNKRALYGRNNSTDDLNPSNAPQIRNENETYTDDNNQNVKNTPQNFQDPTDNGEGVFKTQIRRPEPRTTFKQNVHQYGLKLENPNENLGPDVNRKAPLYNTNVRSKPHKNTDV